jgi:putative solute:sodium symporter small subunit
VSQARKRAHAYWRANLKVLAILLSAWFLAGFVLSIMLVEPLNTMHVAGFPLGFWFAQQGAIVVFVFLILIYACWMDAIESRMAADARADGANADSAAEGSNSDVNSDVKAGQR